MQAACMTDESIYDTTVDFWTAWLCARAGFRFTTVTESTFVPLGVPRTSAVALTLLGPLTGSLTFGRLGVLSIVRPVWFVYF
jgi:hypothetical protein